MPVRQLEQPAGHATEARLNVNNVFAKRYVIPAYNDTGGNNYFGDPRNVQFTLKYTPQW
ncbi:hypothetical protein [Janthinobacterium sp. HLX7-2]|uniref:hypothetical protein n=1 Tax=Janthinobacterium sp. HLX7-2 TaxID=1259331 RepID=UPI003F2299DF